MSTNIAEPTERADAHEIIEEDLATINGFIQEHASVHEIALRGAFRRIEAVAKRSAAPQEPDDAEVIILSSVCGKHFNEDCYSCRTAKESNDHRVRKVAQEPVAVSIPEAETGEDQHPHAAKAT